MRQYKKLLAVPLQSFVRRDLFVEIHKFYSSVFFVSCTAHLQPPNNWVQLKTLQESTTAFEYFIFVIFFRLEFFEQGTYSQTTVC